MQDRYKSDGATCAVCRERVRKGSWAVSYAGFERHPGCAPVSDPAPTVEAGTTEEDDMDSELAAEYAKVSGFTGPHPSPDKGPWFGAMYDGWCSVNECRIYEGDRIRADGQGGYECEDCGDETLTHAVTAKPADWQAQASAAARRHMDAQAFMDPSLVSVNGTDPTPARYITADQFMDPAATDDVKPVMSVSGQPKKVRRDHQDRYAVVLPGETELERYKSSGKPVGRTRVTTFVKAASSTIKLGEWKARNVVIGAARRRDLLLKAQGLTHEDDRDRLDAIVRELEETAGSKVGSDLGTYLHEFTEYMDAGLKGPDNAPEEFQRSLWGYEQALLDAGLEPIRSLIERTTIIREYGWVCGTFDRIFFHRPSGQYVIGDLKTGKTMDYGKNEIECQLWTYAHGVNQNGIYDWNTDTWAFPPVSEAHPARGPITVSESVGVVIHMPVQGPKEGTVSLLWADLEAGKAHADLCHAVRSQPKGKMRPWGDGPAPLIARALARHSAVVAAPAPEPLSPEDTWRALFRGVRTNEGASALWKRAKNEGVSGPFLNELIAIAREAIVRG